MPSLYHEVVRDLRAFVAEISPVDVLRIDWSAFGGVGIDKPSPNLSAPTEGAWIRPTLSGESEGPAGGWTDVQKIGTLVIELRSEVPADQELSGLDVLAQALETALNYAVVGAVQFGSARTVQVPQVAGSLRQQLNVSATYERLDRAGVTLTQEALPVNYTITGHTFVPLQLVYPVGAGAFALALADDLETRARAMVTAVKGDRVSIAYTGTVKIEHGLGAAGDVYLSQSTPGAPTITEPLAGIAQRVAVIVGAGELLLVFDAPETLP